MDASFRETEVDIIDEESISGSIEPFTIARIKDSVSGRLMDKRPAVEELNSSEMPVNHR